MAIAVLHDAEITHKRIVNCSDICFTVLEIFSKMFEPASHLACAFLPELDVVAKDAIAAKVNALAFLTDARLFIELQGKSARKKIIHLMPDVFEIMLIPAHDDDVIHVTQIISAS